MSTEKKDIKAAGAIIAAKDKKPIVVGSQTTITPREDIVSHWEGTTDGTVQGMANSIKKYGIKSQGGSTDLLNYENIDQRELARPTEAREMMERKDIPLSDRVTTHSGSDASARIQLMESLKDMYRAADQANLKTRDQFATSFDALLKKTSPRNRNLLTNPQFQQQISNLKDVAAQHYADLVRSRDEKEANPTLTKKVTTMETMPMGKKVAEVKLRVPKK